MAGIQRHLSANNGENHQAERIQHQKNFAQMRHQWRRKGGDHRRRRDNHDVFRVFDPAERIMAEQDIANGTATNCGH